MCNMLGIAECSAVFLGEYPSRYTPILIIGAACGGVYPVICAFRNGEGSDVFAVSFMASGDGRILDDVMMLH